MVGQDDLNRQFAEAIAALKIRSDDHDRALLSLKEGAEQMVRAINQIKYVLIAIFVGIVTQGGPAILEVVTKILR